MTEFRCDWAYDNHKGELTMQFYARRHEKTRAFGELQISRFMLLEKNGLSVRREIVRTAARRYGRSLEVWDALVGGALDEFNRLRWFHENTYDSRPPLKGSTFADDGWLR